MRESVLIYVLTSCRKVHYACGEGDNCLSGTLPMVRMEGMGRYGWMDIWDATSSLFYQRCFDFLSVSLASNAICWDTK